MGDSDKFRGATVQMSTLERFLLLTENTNPAGNLVDAMKIDFMVMRMNLEHL